MRLNASYTRWPTRTFSSRAETPTPASDGWTSRTKRLFAVGLDCESGSTRIGRACAFTGS